MIHILNRKCAGIRRRVRLAGPWTVLLLAAAGVPDGIRADEIVITPTGWRATVEHVLMPGGVVLDYHEYLDRDGKRVKHGEYRRYYRNGDMRELITFAHGIEDGPFALWQDGNVPLLQGHYARGKLDGAVTRFYASGRKQREFTYRGGVLEGPFVLYFDDGTVQSIGHHRNGQRDGPYAEYYANGVLRMEGRYARGFLSGPVVLYSETGAPRARGTLSRDRVRGPWLCLDTEGRPARTRADCDGTLFWDCACD
jgi:hypothetical protein